MPALFDRIARWPSDDSECLLFPVPGMSPVIGSLKLQPVSSIHRVNLTALSESGAILAVCHYPPIAFSASSSNAGVCRLTNESHASLSHNSAWSWTPSR